MLWYYCDLLPVFINKGNVAFQWKANKSMNVIVLFKFPEPLCVIVEINLTCLGGLPPVYGYLTSSLGPVLLPCFYCLQGSWCLIVSPASHRTHHASQFLLALWIFSLPDSVLPARSWSSAATPESECSGSEQWICGYLYNYSYKVCLQMELKSSGIHLLGLPKQYWLKQ